MGDTRAFCQDEDQIIRERFAAGDKDKQIACVLNAQGWDTRTKDSVRKRRAVLGLLRQAPFGGKKRAVFDTGDYWNRQSISTKEFSDAMRAAGVPEGVRTDPGTMRPQFRGAESRSPFIRSNADF